jgi:hypothetical protein
LIYGRDDIKFKAKREERGGGAKEKKAYQNSIDTPMYT